MVLDGGGIYWDDHVCKLCNVWSLRCTKEKKKKKEAGGENKMNPH